jgi:hypothetical protein
MAEDNVHGNGGTVSVGTAIRKVRVSVTFGVLDGHEARFKLVFREWLCNDLEQYRYDLHPVIKRTTTASRNFNISISKQ